VPEVEILERLATNPKKLSAGGLAFQEVAEKVLANIILGAIEKIKEAQK